MRALRRPLGRSTGKDGREKSFEKDLPAILKALDSLAGRLTPFYREGAPIGHKMYQGILLVGDLFSLTNEEELRSALEDFLLTYVKDREEGIVFKDGDEKYELIDDPVLKEIAHTSLINLHARSVQIEKIAAKTRKVSTEYRQAVVGNYLESYRLFSKHYVKWKEIYDGNIEGLPIVGEIVLFLKYVRCSLHGNLKKVGLEHREVNKETHEYALDGF